MTAKQRDAFFYAAWFVGFGLIAAWLAFHNVPVWGRE